MLNAIDPSCADNCIGCTALRFRKAEGIWTCANGAGLKGGDFSLISPCSDKYIEVDDEDDDNKAYLLHWRHGDRQVVCGRAPHSAMNNAGIGGGAIAALDYYELITDPRQLTAREEEASSC